MKNPLEKELNITVTRSELSQIVSSLMMKIEMMNEELENSDDEQFKEMMKQQIEKVKSVGRKLNPILKEEMSLVKEERKENI